MRLQRLVDARRQVVDGHLFNLTDFIVGRQRTNVPNVWDLADAMGVAAALEIRICGPSWVSSGMAGGLTPSHELQGPEQFGRDRDPDGAALHLPATGLAAILPASDRANWPYARLGARP